MKCDILLTNDDGYRSIGLISLLKELKKIGKVLVVAPEQPRSAAGLSITVHKPLRVKKTLLNGEIAFLVSGTTGDCVSIALAHILSEPPKVVCSGINVGENISLVEFFMSGTIAGAIAAALSGIPAIAFSKKIPAQDVLFVEDIKTGFEEAARIAKAIVKAVMDEGLPDEVDMLSVNFPEVLRETTQVVITRMSRRSFRPTVIERSDPRGRPYYWLWGEKYKSFPEGTDGHAVMNMEAISITPISLSALSSPIKGVQGIVNQVRQALMKIFEKSSY